MLSQADREPSLTAAPSSLSHGSLFELSQGSRLSQSSQRSSTSGSIFRRGSAAPKRRRPDSSCSNSSNNNSADDASKADEVGADRSSISRSISFPAFKSTRSLASKQQAAMTSLAEQPALQVDSASAQAPVISTAPSNRDPEACAAAAAADAKPFQARMHHRQRLARTTPIDVTPPKPSSFIAVTRAIASADDPEAAELLSAVPLCVNWQPTVKGKRRMRRDQQRVTVSSGFGHKRVSFSSADEPSGIVMRITEVFDDDIAMLEVEATKQQQQEAIIDLTEADAEPAEHAVAIEHASSALLSQTMASADEIYWPQVDLRLAVPGMLKKRNLVPAKTFPVRRPSPPRTPSPQPQLQQSRKRKAKAQTVRRAIEHDSDDDDWIVDDAAVEAEEEAIEAQGFDEAEEIVTTEADPRALIKQEFVTSITERAPPAVSLESTVEEEQKQPENRAIVVESTAPMLSQPPPKLRRLLRLSECIPTLPPMPAVLSVAPKPLAAEAAADDHADIAEADDKENQAAIESPAPAAATPAVAAPTVRKGSDVMHDDDGYPLPWINQYTDSPPPNYNHLTDANIVSEDVAKLESVHQLFKGCSCPKGKCWATSCECRVRGSAGYTPPDVVRAQTVEGLTLWECNASCPCNTSCLNRVSQRIGTCNDSLPFYLFRHAEEGLGWGVKCKRPLERGQYLGEYMGVLKGEDECSREDTHDEYMCTIFPGLLHGEDVSELEQLLEARGCANMDEMLANWPRVTVDARDAGNVTRFINHSCDPNLVSIQVYSEDRSPHRAKILYCARVPIPANKELSIDYHYERNPRTGGEWPFVCNCGSLKCQHPTARVRNQLEKKRIDALLEAHTDVDEE